MRRPPFRGPRKSLRKEGKEVAVNAAQKVNYEGRGGEKGKKNGESFVHCSRKFVAASSLLLPLVVFYFDRKWKRK